MSSDTSRSTKRDTSRNIFGGQLESCSTRPMTGFFRNGCCDTGPEDAGSHSVCVVVTDDFLKFSKAQGNDLSTPMPEFGFPGRNLATVGVCVPHAGRKHLKLVKHLALYCVLRTKML
jgi:uncharacterized protein (DUF2237 family)